MEMDYTMMTAGEQSDEVKRKVKMVIERHSRMKSERSNWETHWQECFNYIVPRKGDVVSTRTPGDKRGSELFDTTAIMSNTMLGGALHGMLTNPATRFFEFTMSDPDLNDQEDVRDWLQICADKVYLVINGSNFQTEIHEVYLDLGAIGTACIYVGEHKDNVVHFGARPMKEIFIDEDNLGKIDTVHRSFKWTAKQIVQEFGEDKVPPFVLKKYKEGCADSFEIIHCVCPCDEKPPFKFCSSYILVDENLLLSESNFHEMPFAVPRWTKTSGEKYGRGPGMDMLPDIKMVNKMMETTLKGAQMAVHPPLMVSDDGVIGRVRLVPGGVTVVRPTTEVPIRPLVIDPRIDFGYQVIEDVRKRVRAGFYTDKIQLNDGPQKTATEVNQIVQESLRYMGPILGRQHFEFLRPVIERVFAIMDRKGLIPPAPAAIAKKAFDVRYSSLVAKAQRMSEGENLTRAITVAAPIINADPKTLDNINGDAALKYVFDIYGIPHKLMRNQRELKDLRDGREKAQQELAKQQQDQNSADMVQKMAPGMAQLQQAGKE